MGLVAKISIEERVGSFVIKDVTGLWSSSYTYGYGLPNIVPGWVTSVKAYITPPGYVNSILVDLGSSFAGDGNEYQIMPWDLSSQNTKIESGLWMVEVVIQGLNPSGVPFTYNAVNKCVFTKEVECCIDKMIAGTLNTPLNDVFREEKSRTTAELSVLLNRALNALCCGDITSSNRIITYIKLHCQCGC